MTVPNGSDPVGPDDIMRRLGIDSETFRHWRRLEPLPEPAGTVSSNPAWDWSDVRRWAVTVSQVSVRLCDGTLIAEGLGLAFCAQGMHCSALAVADDPSSYRLAHRRVADLDQLSRKRIRRG